MTRQQLKAIKARQDQNVRRFRDFGLSSERVFPRLKPFKPNPKRFNLQEEKILQRLEKIRME